MNPLNDIIPARYRKVVYAVITLAALVFGIYQASGGDWGLFAAGLLTALTTGTAASNTSTDSARSDAKVAASLDRHNRRLGK